MTNELQTIRFLPCGDTAFSMEFGSEVDRAVNAQVVALYKKVRQAAPEGIMEMIPTFRSLLVVFDPERVRPEALQEQLLSYREDAQHAETGRRWTLPVCYEDEYGPDLADLSEVTGLSPREISGLHKEVSYFVYMIGFLPGYGYMGDVPEPIRVPRRPNPRTRVPRGSVAIAKDMTAIYSLESPGGWHLIGRTPVPMFDPEAESPVLLSPGDAVAFEPVSAKDFLAIERDVASGAYVIRAEGAV